MNVDDAGPPACFCIACPILDFRMANGLPLCVKKSQRAPFWPIIAVLANGLGCCHNTFLSDLLRCPKLDSQGFSRKLMNVNRAAQIINIWG